MAVEEFAVFDQGQLPTDDETRRDFLMIGSLCNLTRKNKLQWQRCHLVVERRNELTVRAELNTHSAGPVYITIRTSGPFVDNNDISYRPITQVRSAESLTLYIQVSNGAIREIPSGLSSPTGNAGSDKLTSIMFDLLEAAVEQVNLEELEAENERIQARQQAENELNRGLNEIIDFDDDALKV